MRTRIWLAAFAALTAAAYLMGSRQALWRVIGAALLALVIADTMTILWDDARVGLAVNGLFAGTLALLLGIAVGATLTWPLRMACRSATCGRACRRSKTCLHARLGSDEVAGIADAHP